MRFARLVFGLFGIWLLAFGPLGCGFAVRAGVTVGCCLGFDGGGKCSL